MPIFSGEQPQYSILDLGYNRSLTKVTLAEQGFEPLPTPEMSNVFTSGTAPKNIIAGELLSDVAQNVGTLFNGKTTFDNTVTGYILGVDTSDSLLKFYIGSSTAYLNWTGTALNIAGTLTASEIHIPDTTTANSFHTDSNGNSWWGATTLATAPASITNAGAITGSSVTITGGSISSTPISSIPNSTATDISLLEFSHDLVFSVTDADTIAWALGTIVMSNGRTFSIDAGNTGNMSALTYIYLDTGVSSTVLQTTTTYSTAMGANKVLLGMARNNTVTASFIPRGGGQPLIDGGNIGALSIVAGNIAASTITSDKISVSQLSAISVDAGTLTAGSISVVNGANTIGFTPSGANAIFSGPTGAPTFYVTPAGVMTATSGTFGSWTIDTNGFSTTGNNIFVGLNAGDAITSGTTNIAIGLSAGALINTGGANVILGEQAGEAITTGNTNTLVGRYAGQSIVTASENTIIGGSAGVSITGASNVVLGVNAGGNITTGVNNVFIGHTAGSIANVSSSIGIGANVSVNASNQLVIGGANNPIQDVYIGEDTSNATPLAVTIQNSAASGTDVAGANLTIAAGRSTGSAAGGSLIFQTSPAGGAGSGVNAFVTALTIDSTGLFTFAGAGAVNFASKSMTNVNIDSGTINGITDLAFADGGTGISSWTQYLIPYAATTTSIGQIAIGTSGQVLTSNGAGAAPTFQDGGTRLGTATTNVTVGSPSAEQGTTETNLISVSVPANTLGTTGGVRVRLHISDFEIAAQVGQTFTLRFKYGATTVATAVLTRPATPISGTRGYVEALLIASGATNSQEGSVIFHAAADPGANVDAVIERYGAAEGTAAEDSTGALNVVISGQWAVLEGNNHITMAHGIVEQIIS